MNSFREVPRRRPLHACECTLLVVVSIHLCAAPWMLGSMKLEAQIFNLVAGLAVFTISLWPRIERVPGQGVIYQFRPYRRLGRFAPFWLGGILLGYIGLQATNPAWQYTQDSKVWWLTQVPHTTWLPTGVSAPFSKSNGWRQVIIYGDAWLLICGIWVGFTQRRTVRLLLGVLAANGLSLAALLFVQRLLMNNRIPWPLNLWTDLDLHSTFIYRNHAGAYFGLLAFATAALAYWTSIHGKRLLRKSTPAVLWWMAAAMLAVTVLASLSRGATICLIASLLIAVAWIFIGGRKSGLFSSVDGRLSLVIAVLTLAGVSLIIRYFDFSDLLGRLNALVVEGHQEQSVHARLLAHAAATDMFKAQGLHGVGAGGFRYLFPEYVKKYPYIYDHGQLYWEHAHCDWLEIPIELGLAGDIVLLGGLGWVIYSMVSLRAFAPGESLLLLAGCGQTALHATFDFPLQCPAILTLGLAMLILALKWAEMVNEPVGEKELNLPSKSEE